MKKAQGIGDTSNIDGLLHNVVKKRTSKGKQKIMNWRKIENKSSRQVTFSKRKGGLFKKCGELCEEHGAQVAAITFSEGGHVFSFGCPNVDFVLQRYLNSSNESYVGQIQPPMINARVNEASTSNVAGNKSEFWWDKPIDNMGLEELEQFKEDLEGLRSEIGSRVNEVNRCPSPSSVLLNFNEYSTDIAGYEAGDDALNWMNMEIPDNCLPLLDDYIS